MLDVLTGKVNPSGKLAESWAKAYADTPARDNFAGDGRTVQYREGLYVGYRYHQTAGVAPALSVWVRPKLHQLCLLLT